jgi:peptidoglycan hydrolase-like protein with peptidoglycan-binding domain
LAYISARLSRIAASVLLLASLALAQSALASQGLGSRVLRAGMGGGDVATLQQLLTKAGFPTRPSGHFGATTQRNVVAFERTYNLAANGIVTKAVVAQLRTVAAAAAGVTGGSSPASAASVVMAQSPRLTVGSTGHYVSELQQDLTFVGYATQVSGAFDQTTAQSVKAFKQANGLRVDPVVGFQTWQALRTAVQSVENTAPTGKARLNSNGLVTAPSDAPAVVQEVIQAANQIAKKPYCYGGGHGRWIDSCYDCSGSVGYALHAAGLLSVSEPSGAMESYGASGVGHWITLYTNAGHVYMQVAGLWFDTAAQDRSNGNDRWSTTRISPASSFLVRHPKGL